MCPTCHFPEAEGEVRRKCFFHVRPATSSQAPVNLKFERMKDMDPPEIRGPALPSSCQSQGSQIIGPCAILLKSLNGLKTIFPQLFPQLMIETTQRMRTSLGSNYKESKWNTSQRQSHVDPAPSLTAEIEILLRSDCYIAQFTVL